MAPFELLQAAEAYERERALWRVRTNKAFSPVRYEIVRCPYDGDPEVKGWTIAESRAMPEMEERRMLAAMKAAIDAVSTEPASSGET